MAWKPKEKELTLAEAIELARDSEQKYWFGSSPLLAGVAHDGQFSVHALDKEFKKSKAFLIFLNPCQFGGETAVIIAKELIKRYQSLGIQPIFILQPEFHFYFHQKFIESFQKRFQLYFPIVVDNENVFGKAFGVKAFPEAVLVANEKIVFKIDRNLFVNDLETKMKEFLRQSDPGLPTLLPFLSKTPFLYESADIAIPWKKFVKVDKNSVYKPTELPDPYWINHQIEVKGQWLYDEDRLTTKDGSAEIYITGIKGHIGIVAQSVTESGESSRISLDWNGTPLEREKSLEDVFHDDEGNSFSKFANTPKLHKIYAAPTNGTLHIKFSQAQRIPIAIYAFRMSQAVQYNVQSLP